MGKKKHLNPLNNQSIAWGYAGRFVNRLCVGSFLPVFQGLNGRSCGFGDLLDKEKIVVIWCNQSKESDK